MGKKKNCIYILVALLFCLIVFNGLVLAVDGNYAEEIYKNAPEQEDYPDAGGVIIKNQVICDFTSLPYKTEVNKAYKVFNKRGIDTFGEANISFDSERENVKIIEAYTIKPDGSVVEVAENAIHEITPPELTEANIYSAVKEKVINFPALEAGSIIVYKYIIEEVEPLISEHFWQSKYFGFFEPTQQCSLSIKVPQDKEIYYNVIRGDIETEISKEEGYDLYRWEKHDLPAVVQEVAMPDLGDIIPLVRVSTFATWQEFSDWYCSLIDEQYTLNETVRTKISELTVAANSREEKIRALYNYVAISIRYVGLEFGIDGYKPHGAIDVFENKYGDCKDKATLLIAMLAEIGVKAEPVLIGTGGHSELEISSPDHFNHMIVYLPEEELYLDPTSDVTIYGNLPAVDQGKKIIKPLSNQIVETPVDPAEINSETIKQEIYLAADGSAKIDISWIDLGVYDAVYKSLFKQFNEQQRELVLKQIINTFYPNAVIEDYEMIGVDGLSEVFEMSIQLSLENYSQKMGNLVAVKPFRIDMNLSQIVGAEERENPVYIGYRLHTGQEMIIHLPEGFVVNYLPEDLTIENEVGSLTLKLTQAERQIIIKFDLNTKKQTFALGEYTLLRDLFNKAQEITDQQVLLQVKGD